MHRDMESNSALEQALCRLYQSEEPPAGFETGWRAAVRREESMMNTGKRSTNRPIWRAVVHAFAALVLVAGNIYRVRHTRGGAVLALVCGTLAMTAAMLVFNHFLTPYFITPDISDAAAVAAKRAYVDTLLFPFIAPFNLIKAGANSVITFGVYKVVSRYIIHGEAHVKGSRKAAGEI